MSQTPGPKARSPATRKGLAGTLTGGPRRRGGLALLLPRRWRRGGGRCSLGTGADVVGPAAVVGAKPALFDRNRPRCDSVEDRSVVGDEQHRPRKRLQRGL